MRMKIKMLPIAQASAGFLIFDKKDGHPQILEQFVAAFILKKSNQKRSPPKVQNQMKTTKKVDLTGYGMSIENVI